MAHPSLQSTPPALPPPVRKMLEKAVRGEALDLPLLPQTAMEVMEACNEEDVDAGSLSELLEHDQSLASHVLRVANSAAYAPQEPIISLQQAMSRLGISTICEIAVSIAVKGRVFRVPGYQVRIRELWMHSAAAGVYAKEVARRCGCEVDSAFLCGLLHDIGKPIVMHTLIEEVKRRTDRPIPSSVMEGAIAEFHELVGALVIRSWGFPAWVVEAVSRHHDYASVDQFQGRVMVASLANELSHWALADNTTEKDFPAELPVIEDLDLSAEDLIGLLEKRGSVLEVVEAFL
jgi:putative nucleotidyltransferase with HDIG domain